MGCSKSRQVAATEIVVGQHANAGKDQAMLRDYLNSSRGLNLSERTLKHNRYAINLLLAWLAKRDKSLPDVTEADAASFLAQEKKRLALGSWSGIAGVVRRFFRYLEDRNLIFMNPVAKLIVRHAPTRIKPVPSEDEIRRLLEASDVSDALGIRNRALMEVAYSTGIRAGELLGMKLRDPDFDKGVLRVLGKGRKERVVPLGSHARAWLLRYMKSARPELLRCRKDDGEDEQATWLNQWGQPLSILLLERMVSHQAQEAGIKTPVTPHTLRRACATHMLRHGAHPVEIQTLLGHASLGTLCHYLQVTILDLQRMHGQSKMGR